jgi:hypothetical protein
MAKPAKPNVRDALRLAQGQPAAPVAERPSPRLVAADDVALPAPAAPSGRDELVQISGHFSEEVRIQFTQLGTKFRPTKTRQSLLTEAINDLFTKYGMPPIAKDPPSKRRKG